VNADKNRWLVSPNVRSSYAEDSALLLDVKKGLSYRLNVLGVQVWVAIEQSPGGITLKGIVDVLETRFSVPRKQLESDTADCLDKLRELGLVQKEKNKAANGG